MGELRKRRPSPGALAELLHGAGTPWPLYGRIPVHGPPLLHCILMCVEQVSRLTSKGTVQSVVQVLR